MKVAVVNASHFGMKAGNVLYNLAVEKIKHYHILRGDEVISGPWSPLTMKDCQKFYFSVIFTWDLLKMIQAVNLVRSWGKEVEIGGPAATFMHRYIAKHTGINPHIGLDERFEHVPGKYKLTFTSRGCPHNCLFCGVRRVEPVALEYDDFPLASMIGDNNILATSWEHQELVVNKLVKFNREIDINSGFDVRFFREKHYELYSRLNLKCWRFAFDSMDVWEDVWRVAKMMRDNGLDRHHVTFYCCPKGTPILTAEGNKAIERICLDDHVLGADGKFHRVTATSSRKYQGNMVSFTAGRINQTIRLTEKHRLDVYRDGHWLEISASDIKVNDDVFIPLPEGEEIPDIPKPTRWAKGKSRKPLWGDKITQEFCRLLGYYLAEGSICSNGHLVVWIFEEGEEWLDDVMYLLQTLGLEGHRRIMPDHSERVEVCSTELAYALKTLGGGLQPDRFIHPSLYMMPEEFLWELLVGYFRGDASLVTPIRSTKDRVVGAGSTSLSMLLGLFMITSRLGLTFSINASRYEESTGIIKGRVVRLRPSYSLRCGLVSDVKQLAMRVWGQLISGGESRPSYKIKIIDGRILLPVRNILIYPTDETVYNLTAEDAHSYLAKGVCVHNCLIGFPRTTPFECLFRLNTIIELGMNPYPMRYIPLNSLSHKYVAKGYTEDILFRMQTYFQSPYIWMADSWENFRPSKRAYNVHPDQASFIGGDSWAQG